MRKFSFNKIYVISAASIILLVALALTPFDNIKQVQYKLIFHNFLESKSDADHPITNSDGEILNSKWYPDMSTIFYDTSHIGSSISESDGKFVIRTIESSYYSSPGYLDRYMSDILGTTYMGENFEEKFIDNVHTKPFSRYVITADKQKWYFWSGAAVEKIFNKYYTGPDNLFQQVTYGFIYNLAAKNYMKDYVQILNHLLVDKKAEWIRACNAYYTKAMTDPNFDGSYQSSLAVDSLFSTNKKSQFKIIDTSYLYKPVGELMRRQIDGSLPSIIKCVKRVLKDYDPMTFRQLKVK